MVLQEIVWVRTCVTVGKCSSQHCWTRSSLINKGSNKLTERCGNRLQTPHHPWVPFLHSSARWGRISRVFGCVITIHVGRQWYVLPSFQNWAKTARRTQLGQMIHGGFWFSWLRPSCKGAAAGREEFGSGCEPAGSLNPGTKTFPWRDLKCVDVVLRDRAWQCWVNRSNDLKGLLQPKLFHGSLIPQKLKKPLWFYEWTHTLPELTHFTHILLIKIGYHHPLRMAWRVPVPKDLRGNLSSLYTTWPLQRAQLFKAEPGRSLPSFLLFVRSVFKLDTWRLNHCKSSSNQ